MTNISFVFEHGLIFIPITLTHEGNSLTFKKCIVDTGSSGTTFEVSLAEKIGLNPSPESTIRFLTAIGGKESVYTRMIDKIYIGDKILNNKHVEFGDLETTFHIDGIIGNDILRNFNVEICYKNQIMSLNEY